MTTDKPSLPKDWPYATNCIALLLDQREEFACQQLFAAVHELMELGLGSEEMANMIDEHLMECDEYGMPRDEVEQPLLSYPMQMREPWETCHPECRTTVEHMRKQIESARGVPPEGGALYDRWIASRVSSEMLVATIKHECGLDLSCNEQVLLAVAAYRGYTKRRDADWSSYSEYPSFADDQGG